MVAENLAAIRKFLKNTLCLPGKQKVSTGGRPKGTIESGSIRHIYDWLSKNGEVFKNPLTR